jgi:hypothetical protein
MAKRTRNTSGAHVIFLPWEKRSAFRGSLVSGRRWRAGLVAAVLLGALFVTWRVADRRYRIRLTRASIAEVQRAVAAFRAEIGRCPHSTVELVHPPRAGAQYLSELPDDGWGRAFHVRCPARDDPGRAEVISAGPSGSFSKDDNIF